MKTKLGLLLSCAAFFILGFCGCTIGLGEAVDTQNPELKINLPRRAEIVRSAFVLSGKQL